MITKYSWKPDAQGRATLLSFVGLAEILTIEDIAGDLNSPRRHYSTYTRTQPMHGWSLTDVAYGWPKITRRVGMIQHQKAVEDLMGYFSMMNP